MTKIKTELLKLYISDYIKHNITDFEIVEEIVCLFEKHKLDFGYRHDF